MKKGIDLRWVTSIIALFIVTLACGSGGGGAPEITPGTFKRVCDGEGVEGTSYYGQNEGFHSQWNLAEAELTELAVCLTVIDSELVAECYYSKEGSDDIDLTDQLYSATYEAVLRNAITTEIYDTTTYQIEHSGECPETTADFLEMGVRKFYPDPGITDLINFLTPWVLPSPK
jgi:hypothetical protein